MWKSDNVERASVLRHTPATPLLDTKQSSLFHGFVGSANWMITLDRFDIAYATAALARFSMAPREGHIHAMKHLFGYVKQFPHGQIIIDHSEHVVKAAKVQPEYDWSEYYPVAEGIMPPDMPIPKGRTIKITAYKDADFA
jgi:hypothetical protein